MIFCHSNSPKVTLKTSVITNLFTKYAIAIPNSNQKLFKKSLYKKFICYYGFAERIDFDKEIN